MCLAWEPGEGDGVWPVGAQREHKPCSGRAGTAQTCPRAEPGPRGSVWNVNIIPAREKEVSRSPRAAEVNVWQGNRGMINREVQPCRGGWGSCSGDIRVTPKPGSPAGSSRCGGLSLPQVHLWEQPQPSRVLPSGVSKRKKQLRCSPAPAHTEKRERLVLTGTALPRVLCQRIILECFGWEWISQPTQCPPSPGRDPKPHPVPPQPWKGP